MKVLNTRLSTGSALALLLVSANSCAYLNAAISPAKLRATGNLPTTGGAPTSLIEAKSSKKSQISGRNNLVVQAAIAKLEPGRAEVLVLLTSTTLLNTDPRNFYVRLKAGDQWLDPDELTVGDANDSPYSYQVSVPVTVQAGYLQYGSERVDIYRTEHRKVNRAESYFARSSRLVFRGDAIGAVADAPMALELTDLGVDVELRWEQGQGEADDSEQNPAQGSIQETQVVL